MDYEAGGAADATTLGRLGLVPVAEGQALGGPPSGTYDIEGFSPVISLQVAARAARYQIRSGTINKGTGTSHAIGIQQGSGRINLEEHVSPSRSFQLVLVFAIAAAVCACVVYFMLGGYLPPPLPSPA